MAASRKEDKYVDLGARYIFEPIAVENLGVFNASARQLLADLGKRIPSILARLERPSIYFKGFLFWCSALMLFCCMTVCRPLTARTDDRTHLCIA